MTRKGVVLTIAVVSIAVAAGVLAVVLTVAPPYQVIYSKGTVVRFMGVGQGVDFIVRAGGGILEGAADVDHSADLGAFLPVAHSCGDIPPGPDYGGAPWYLTLKEHLDPGKYWFSAWCSAWANMTVTAPIEVVYW